MTDNGPPFRSQEFKEYVAEWIQCKKYHPSRTKGERTDGEAYKEYIKDCENGDCEQKKLERTINGLPT